MRWLTKIGGCVVVVFALLMGQNSAMAANTAAEFNAQGIVFYNANQFSQAIVSFEEAFRLVPDNTVLRHNLCNAHQAAANELAKVADFAAAAKHLEAAIAVEPLNYSPFTQLGSYYLRLDMVAEAIVRLERAIELAPENLDAHDLLGDAYYMDNDIASAQVQWGWVAKMAPERPGLAQKIEKASREGAVESNFRPSGSRHFQLSASPDIAVRALRQVLSFLEQAYVDVGRSFWGVYPPSPIQVIVYNAQGFAEATQQGAHVGALYDGKIRIPLTDASGNPLPEQELRERLYHEFTHVVVRFLGNKNVPWWLNEGLAEVFSRDLTPLQTALIQKAVEDNVLFSLSALEDNQLAKQDPDSLRLAYSEAHVVVQYLLKRYGQVRLSALMSELAEGIPPRDAILRQYHRTYDSLEKEIVRSAAMLESNAAP